MSEKTTDPTMFELSDNRQINRLLNNIVKPLKEYTETQTQNFFELVKIGVALSSVRGLDQLLEMIVEKARAFTNSDGGTLYLVNDDETALNFTIVQTESVGFRMGGITGGPVTLPPVQLHDGDEPNNSHVCAYVANSGEPVNIADVYTVEGFNFEGARNFDKMNNYRSKSMMVIPMRDHQDEIIGVLQLLNARNSKGETIPYAEEYQSLTEALASQAAVSITNTRLISDLQNLFESFIKTIAAAIDEKSPYAGGHIERVANLTMVIASRINEATEGKYADVHFTDDELSELRLAAWLHDTGKITTPEYVVDKRTKLETIFDRKELVRLRFELAMANRKTGNGNQPSADNEPTGVSVDEEQMMKDMEFILQSNETGEFLPDENIERLKALSQMQIQTSKGPEPLLTDDELYNLSIRKGNLTNEERDVINNHALITIKLLEQLPFPKKLKNVPFYAGAHHEKLNGKGYPLGLTADQIPLQARIMALADIFEALTAKDRPYKKPMKMSQALRILGFMVKDGELDPELVDFFLNEKIYVEYAREHLDPDKLDVE